MGEPLRVLIVEDSEDDAALLVRELQRGGYDPAFERVESAAAMRIALQRHAWDLVVSDHSIPRFDALGALAVLKESGLDLPFIIVSGTIGEEVAVAAMKAGAHDYITKGRLARLVPAIQRELRETAERAARRRAEAERQRLEDQFRQAQKMETVGRLAGGIAHDFNNLLTAIIGFSELLLLQLNPADPRHEFVEEIARAGQRAAALTRQLLAFSRQQVLEPVELDLNAVVVDAEKMLRRMIGEDLALVTVPAPTPGLVKADRGQIEQVIMNLAINARDAMPRGGKLTIETANVDLDATYAETHVGAQPGPYVMLVMSDTGSGMDAETISHIFEPFFTTKEPGKGTGLGLSTVFGIVEQSGGHIAVESAPGRGTTFRIYLPQIEAVESAPMARAPGIEMARGSEMVLLVEDELLVRTLARHVLEAGGYTVLEASNGEEAVALGERENRPIPLLITDVVMPGMSGSKVAERLTARHPELKVLYTSGYTTDAVVLHGVSESSVAFLRKPFTPGSLLKKVREVLDALTRC